MTLTQSSSDANNGSRQRFELELLLQRAVPNPDQLNRSKDLLKDAVDGISPDGWKHLQSVPINSDSAHLDIAIPSHWRDEDWQRLIEQFRPKTALLSTSLIRQKVLPDMALSMLAIGEETGEMDKMLSKVADFYEDEVGAMVKALTSMPVSYTHLTLPTNREV